MENRLVTKSLIMLFVSITIIGGCKKSTDHQNLTAQTENHASLAGSKEFCGPLSNTTGVSGPVIIKSVVIPNTTVYNTDLASAGVAGGITRVIGSPIALSGVSGTVTKAFLYWHGVTNSLTDAGNTIMVNATTVNGTNIGVSSSNCWPFNNSQAYRADVTALVQSTGNGNYILSEFGALNPNGASLIVFFNDGSSLNNRDVVIFDGNDSNVAFGGIIGNPNAPADPQGWDVLLSGINYTSGTANIQLHVGDGQPFLDAALFVNATELVPAGGIFQGNSVAGGELWDIQSFNVTSFLSPGLNSLNFTSGLDNDCLGLIVALIDLPAGAAPPADNIKVGFDFKPGCCPNPFSCSTKGTVPAAILGASDFDVSKIDVSTIKLNGISPTAWTVKDVATPFKGDSKDCNSCTTGGPDGIKDLALTFDNQALVPTLKTTTNNQCITITITGKLLPAFGSTSFTGEDRILIKK